MTVAELRERAVKHTLPTIPDSIKTTPQVTLNVILETLADAFDCKVGDLLGSSRKQPFAWARQVAMWLLRNDLHRSFPQIAADLHRQDHTTIIHGVNVVQQRMDNDHETQVWLTKLRIRLGLEHFA